MSVGITLAMSDARVLVAVTASMRWLLFGPTSTIAVRNKRLAN